MTTKDTSQYVNQLMPQGIPCQNPNCPYNDIAYYQGSVGKPNDSWKGLCLNCLDDERRDQEFFCY